MNANGILGKEFAQTAVSISLSRRVVDNVATIIVSAIVSCSTTRLRLEKKGKKDLSSVFMEVLACFNYS